MGVAKSELIAAEDRGWWLSDDQYVCEECVEDDFLKAVIRENLVEAECSYCGRTHDTEIAAPLDEIVKLVANAVMYRFNEPTHAGVPVDGGAFIIESRSTEDVLLSLPFECHEDLFVDVAQALVNNYWVQAAGGHWSSSHEHELMNESWRIFVRTVCHETRFHFHSMAG